MNKKFLLFGGFLIAFSLTGLYGTDNQNYTPSGGSWEKTGSNSYEHKGATFSGFRYSEESAATNTYKYEVSPPSGWSFVASKTTFSGGIKIADPTATSSGIKKINDATKEPTSFILSMGGELTNGQSGDGTVTWSASAKSDFYYILPNQKIMGIGKSTTLSAKGGGTSVSSNWTCSPTWTGYAALKKKSSITFGHGGDWDPPAGQYTITAKKASDASRTDTASVAIVQVSSVSVESGASQTHVTGSKNWAAIKATPGDVVIKATINPPIAEGSIPADLITWTGGTAVSGQLLHRKVSKTTSAKTNVKATCGTSEAEANIWVIWASITIQTSGDKPSAANTLFFALNNPKCGPTTSSQVGYGNICGIVTLTPAGVGEIISSGWDIKREQQHLIITITNSTPTEKSRDTSWTDDDAHNQDEILQPINGKLYVIDNPSICYEYPGVDIIIVMRNFREWLAWNGKKCSDYSPWYFRGLFDAVSGGIIPQVGVGRIDFPAAPKQ